MSQDDAKRAAAARAATLIENGMIVGLGSGSTARFFIQSLIERKLSIQTVSSSRESAELARKGGLIVLDINAVSHVDLTVDGADEIDPQKRMIKGGGGAHVREKILATSSNEMIVIVDETKLVAAVGVSKLPIEVIYYGSQATKAKIDQLGYKGKWRMNANGTLFLTDNGNFIYDIYFDAPPASPEELHSQLLHIPGVLDTGFFFNIAGRVIVGYSNGKTELSI